MTAFSWLWITWLFAPWVIFAIVEGVALRNDMPGDTLSEHIRKWLSVKTRPGRTAFLIVWLIGLGVWLWFVVHILTGLV